LQHWNGNKSTHNGIQLTTLGIIYNMGTSLNGLTPAGTYPGLIKTGDNAPIDGTLKTLSDGNGNNLPMEVSTTGVNFTNNLTQGGTALQPVLVSGTNIKTINGTSVLGSGDIVTPTTPPSGVSGAIQFSNGSAFASDAANLFWDDTNNRLGVGLNNPSARVDIKGVGTTSATTALSVANSAGTLALQVLDDSRVVLGNSSDFAVYSGSAITARYAMSVGTTSLPTATLQVKGSGSTSATTSLLVQNSAGTAALTVRDDLSAIFGSGLTTKGDLLFQRSDGSEVMSFYNAPFALDFGSSLSRVRFQAQTVSIGGLPNASAALTIDSTTRGFLPPVMTTTQKNAIATPASGLVVYDSTTNKLCCYNGSTWNDLF
jgi:hypothetical protein